MRVILSIALSALVVVGCSSAAPAASKAPTRTEPVKEQATQEATMKSLQRKVEEHAQAVQLKRLARKVASFRSATWDCQDVLHRKRTPTSFSVWGLPRSVAYRTEVVQQWQQNATSCLNLQRERTVPKTNDWVTAVNVAQRYYPYTKDRLLQISHHEGGNGPWVWYAGMCGNPPCLWTGYHLGADPFGDDAVGGWLQFRYSTFITYYLAMLEDMKRRGFIVPDLGWARPSVSYGASTGYGPWLSPLGQALTAGFMHHYGKQGCHWCGA